MPTKKNDAIETPVGVSEDTFDLLEWIESGTVARRTVTIHNDPALVTEYEDLERQLAGLGWTDSDDEARENRNPEASLGDGAGPEVERLLAQREDLYERWQASKSTWTVRAVSDDEIVASFDVVPEPKAPVPPADTAPTPVREKWAERLQSYVKTKQQADADRKLALLVTAVVGIETTRGTTDRVTLEQLKALRARPHGGQWIEQLHTAMEAATENDVEIPRPTSSGRSATSQA